MINPDASTLFAIAAIIGSLARFLAACRGIALPPRAPDAAARKTEIVDRYPRKGASRGSVEGDGR